MKPYGTRLIRLSTAYLLPTTLTNRGELLCFPGFVFSISILKPLKLFILKTLLFLILLILSRNYGSGPDVNHSSALDRNYSSGPICYWVFPSFFLNLAQRFSMLRMVYTLVLFSPLRSTLI